MTEEEEVCIILDHTTSSAMLVDVSSKTTNSISRGNRISEESPGKGFK
jgi:hypothetical protein